jgi:hypothetical protein
VIVGSGKCAQGLKSLLNCTGVWGSRYANSRKPKIQEDLCCRSGRKARPLDLAKSRRVSRENFSDFTKLREEVRKVNTSKT